MPGVLQSPQCGADLRYRSPTAPGAPGALPPVALAGFWLRAAALLIDYIVLLGLVVLILGLGGRLLRELLHPSLDYRWLLACILGPTLFLYYALLESSPWQATIGKRALRLAVTDLHSNRVSLARAMGRTLAKTISTIILYFGFIMAGFTDKKQALHDMIAGCLVVRIR